MPIGVELDRSAGGAHARVWAPAWREVRFVVEGGREISMEREPGGYFSCFAPGAAAGARYRFRLGDQLYADPASRYQPEGPFGPSEIIDPDDYAWRDHAWRGVEPHRHVIYEMHVGTFTPEGTWRAAAAQLPFLAELGVTTIEVMPIAEFPGAFNWGYDGVDLFAPAHVYGTPRDLRAFVDRAHALGLAVILDVVYNHLGPAGNVYFTFAPAYRSEKYANEWGDALDFDGETSGPVRELFVANAGYWIDEHHFDGLRLDATQQIFDASREHVVAAITRRAREAGGGRRIFVVAENEPQDTACIREHGVDALWNDDFHHSAVVAATGVIDGYLHDYAGTAQELISAVKRGFLYQGQMYPWQRKPRGTSTRGLAPHCFVTYLENHDQVANLGFGERLIDRVAPARLRALTALLLLAPQLPLLFQGQETGSRAPWRFFADHDGDLGRAVRGGRAQFVAQFAQLATPEAQAALADPTARATFAACALDPRERDFARPIVALHRDLLRLRTELRIGEASVDGAVLSERTFVLFSGDAILLVNLGPTARLTTIAEPLLAPPAGTGWRVRWSSEDPRYGGHGTPPPFLRRGLHLPADSAILCTPDPDARLADDPSRLARGNPEPLES
ncbi:MAG TPA: malto-oligosyltrehalose trehalohydrolase [Kofleriaceae bacterium]|nr:malto-oligosyltrehalose trehalohydrolase [Kofleriaceae bacterium]